MSRRQRLGDQLTDPALIGWVGGEQHSNVDGFIVGECCVGVVWCQRTWRLVVPMSAQRNGYRTAGGAGIAAGIEDHDGIVGVGGANHVRAAVGR